MIALSSNPVHSRRTFLSTSAIALVGNLWIPRGAKGYSASEVTAKLAGGASISKWDLDTPALCVDLDGLDRNIKTLQTAVTGLGIDARPHAKTHKSAVIPKRQLAAGAIGICCAKLGEAEALSAQGVDRLCMTTAILSTNKISRAMQLRKTAPDFIQAVDHEKNARDLSAAAQEAGVTADVVIDVAVGTRTGVPPGDPALALAKLVDTLPNLTLLGLLSYDGGAQHVTGFEKRKARTLAKIAPNVRTFEAMKQAGLRTEIFSGGGTATYNMQHLVPGFTDVQAGSYVFMDRQYLAIGGENGPIYNDFEPSLTVLTTVLNNRFLPRLTTDAGAKVLTINTPRAGVKGEPDADYNAGSDEFGVVNFKSPPSRSYAIGDPLELIVPHCDPVVNLYDVMYGIRGDLVEEILPIKARGRSQQIGVWIYRRKQAPPNRHVSIVRPRSLSPQWKGNGCS
ncbi:MAG: D-serine deaminase-like pyridoxal phosphate-dependent protein [Verrucomicrobiales bacterium]